LTECVFDECLLQTLLTGRAPNYLDVLKNFQTAEGAGTGTPTTKISQDNLIWALRREKPDLKICFFGDETWLRLFPSKEDGSSEYFHKFEGVTSFFVKDFYQVDQNVTRNLKEMKDCQFLILHFLGLDHIGHVYGPSARKDLIKDKLNEMDEVVKQIHARLVDRNGSNKNLLLVTGDHGMANAGGHGGSSLEEVTTPLISITTGLASLSLEPAKEVIDQVDIAPTLASLWGLRIPKESKGQLILDIMEQFQSSQQLATSYQNNCEHLLKAMGEAREAATYRLWWNEISKLDKPLSIKKYIELENELVSAIQGVKKERNLWSSFLPAIIVLVVSEMIVLVCIGSSFSKSWKGMKPAIALTIVPPILIYFSSSFIEEEHYIRYFLYSIMLLSYCVFLKPVDIKCVMMVLKIMILHRIAISFNQTGDKWSHLPDLNDTIVKYNLSWVTAAVGTALIVLYARFSNMLCKGFAISLGSVFAIEMVLSMRSESVGEEVLP
jgi:ethanolaminephosphotransferase